VGGVGGLLGGHSSALTITTPITIKSPKIIAVIVFLFIF
jgi:hypothetical protein